jgi:cation transport ATPase
VEKATISLKTNIHCDSCVSQIKPHLEQLGELDSWAVDTEDANKTLTVMGSTDASHVINAVKKAGFEAELLHSEEKKAGNSGFWNDIPKWKRASFNTLNCLIGCSIGDFGMIIFLQAYYPETSLMLQMILAIIAGLCTSIALETTIMKVRESFTLIEAFKVALSMSFMSMVAMEIAMNITDFLITGGEAAFQDPLYWGAFGIAAIAGFITPLPYNYYKLKKHNKACH